MKKYYDKLELIERNLLALGSDVYVLKNEVSILKKTNKSFFELLKGLKIILKDKGVLTADDFEHAVEFSKALSLLDSQIEEFFDEELLGSNNNGH